MTTIAVTIDHPLVRASLVCPLCHGEKDQGLVACWPCFRARIKRGGDREAERALDAAEAKLGSPEFCEGCGEAIHIGTCPTIGLGDDDPDRCSHPLGHEWAFTGSAYGGDDDSYMGEGRSYCLHCGADSDA